MALIEPRVMGRVAMLVSVLALGGCGSGGKGGAGGVERGAENERPAYSPEAAERTLEAHEKAIEKRHDEETMALIEAQRRRRAAQESRAASAADSAKPKKHKKARSKRTSRAKKKAGRS